MSRAPHWRSMRAADLIWIVPLADALFPDHPEDVSCFTERLALGGDLCLTLASDDRHTSCGHRGSPLPGGEGQGEARDLSGNGPHLTPTLSFQEREHRRAPRVSPADDAGIGGDIAGYTVAYPWPLGHIPSLNRPLGALGEAGGAVYLHDLAVHPGLSGRGYAGAGVALLVERARMRDANAIALVAVNDSAAFWQARGFAHADADPDTVGKLAGYGEGAHYMILAL